MKEEVHQKRHNDSGSKDEDDITPMNTDGQIIIEEKQSKPNGEVNITQYVRGTFLGKVSNTF